VRPAARPLTGLEHAFVRYESRLPVGNLQIGGLSSFAGRPPELVDVRRFVAAKLDALPALSSALRREGGRLRWVRRSGADPARHVHEWVAAPGGLRAAADAIMARRLVRGAPPWEFWLVRGHADDEWAILFKAHHALLDGASLIEATCLLAGRAPDRPPAPRRARRVRRADLGTVARGAVGYLARFLPPATRAFSTAGRTGQRRFAWTTTSAARLRELADAHGCTRNDVFLAALAAVLREWPHTPWRRGARPVWTLVPVDLHDRHEDHELRTRVVNLRVPLPCDEPDPLRRLRAIGRATARAKGDGRIGVAGAAERSLPGWFVRAVFALTFSRAHIDLLASNVRGPRWVLEYEGVPLERMAPLGFVPRGHPLAAYLITHDDRVCVGFAVDSSLPDGEELCRLWQRALDDLDDLAAAAPRAATDPSPVTDPAAAGDPAAATERSATNRPADDRSTADRSAEDRSAEDRSAEDRPAECPPSPAARC